ncbi:hypothetical protein HRbin15_01075 [bacterium HR15]|nr:hypothetical protein HRbin15_01075 [bacterium HR15]
MRKRILWIGIGVLCLLWLIIFCPKQKTNKPVSSWWSFEIPINKGVWLSIDTEGVWVVKDEGIVRMGPHTTVRRYLIREVVLY